jgi:hypothetical protein
MPSKIKKIPIKNPIILETKIKLEKKMIQNEIIKEWLRTPGIPDPDGVIILNTNTTNASK